jgi:hypothetical protein
MRSHLTMEQRLLARKLNAKGMSLREIGRQIDCSHQLVRSLVARDHRTGGLVASHRSWPASVTPTTRTNPAHQTTVDSAYCTVRADMLSSTSARSSTGHPYAPSSRSWRAR